MTRTGRTLLAIVLGLAAALSVTLGGAHAGVGLQCGDEVSGEVTLTEDLNCTGTTHGLIVVGDDTTINLNRHVISGDDCDDSEDGISNLEGYDNLTIMGATPSYWSPNAGQKGTITGFCEGIFSDDGVDGFTDNLKIVNLALVENRVGMRAFVQDGLVIRHSTASNNMQDGFEPAGEGSPTRELRNAVIEHNLAYRNGGEGIRVDNLRGGIVRCNKSFRNDEGLSCPAPCRCVES